MCKPVYWNICLEHRMISPLISNTDPRSCSSAGRRSELLPEGSSLVAAYVTYFPKKQLDANAKRWASITYKVLQRQVKSLGNFQDNRSKSRRTYFSFKNCFMEKWLSNFFNVPIHTDSAFSPLSCFFMYNIVIYYHPFWILTQMTLMQIMHLNKIALLKLR